MVAEAEVMGTPVSSHVLGTYAIIECTLVSPLQVGFLMTIL